VLNHIKEVWSLLPPYGWTHEKITTGRPGTVKSWKKLIRIVDLSTKPGGTLPDVSELQFITGNCPMMYLSIGPNIHVVHRSIAKLIWKY